MDDRERDQLVGVIRAAEQRAASSEEQLKRYEEAAAMYSQSRTSTYPQNAVADLPQVAVMPPKGLYQGTLGSTPMGVEARPTMKVRVTIMREDAVRFNALVESWEQGLGIVAQYLQQTGYEVGDQLSMIGFTQTTPSAQRSINLKE